MDNSVTKDKEVCVCVHNPHTSLIGQIGHVGGVMLERRVIVFECSLKVLVFVRCVAKFLLLQRL